MQPPFHSWKKKTPLHRFNQIPNREQREALGYGSTDDPFNNNKFGWSRYDDKEPTIQKNEREISPPRGWAGPSNIDHPYPEWTNVNRESNYRNRDRRNSKENRYDYDNQYQSNNIERRSNNHYQRVREYDRAPEEPPQEDSLDSRNEHLQPLAFDPTTFSVNLMNQLQALTENRNVPSFVCREAAKLSSNGIKTYGFTAASNLAQNLIDLTVQQTFYALTASDQEKSWKFNSNFQIIKAEGLVKEKKGVQAMRGIPLWVQKELKNASAQTAPMPGGQFTSRQNSSKFHQWLQENANQTWFKLLHDNDQRNIWNIAQKQLAITEYSQQKFNNLKETATSCGIPVNLIKLTIDERQKKFSSYFMKLSTKLETYKQLMFDYDALCFIPDRNERIMNRLKIVRDNLFQNYNQMKKTSLSMAFINKINELTLDQGW